MAHRCAGLTLVLYGEQLHSESSDVSSVKVVFGATFASAQNAMPTVTASTSCRLLAATVSGSLSSSLQRIQCTRRSAKICLETLLAHTILFLEN